MKSLWKGVLLGISLVVANHLCCLFFGGWSDFALVLFSGIVFFAVTTAFLVSPSLVSLFACGFCGLFVMVFGALFTINGSFSNHLTSYLGGFWGSMVALGVSVYLTANHITIASLFYKGEKTMPVTIEKNQKWKLLLYALVSAISFSYLMMPENAGISVPIFCLIQFFCLWFMVPDRKRLLFFIPIFILSLNSFYSAAAIWRPSNFMLSAVLYCCMFINFDFKTDSLGYLKDIGVRLFAPFLRFSLPFRWALDSGRDKAPVFKKVVIALVISVPCALILIGVLANADMVFSMQIEQFTSKIFQSVNGHFLFVALCGILVGLYLFGMIYHAHLPKNPDTTCGRVCKGDLVIINILLSSVLLVYTLFVIIQFKYLFAGAALPYGLTYTEYARKGFFELLALTGVNIAAILAVVKLTKGYCGKWFVFTKILCQYLCGVTVILLVSSFYRMLLYTGDDGLTRLRMYVMGFLIFEAMGLVATFFYIAKPKFNITLTYLSIALSYYLILNIVPADNIIAQNQVDRYLKGECETVSYIYTLSADAAPAMQKLYETGDETTRQEIRAFLEGNTNFYIPFRWQRYNISVEQAKDFLIDKFY